jgi:NAD(P)-dependent dehydrogenase (short-subunit alcohol dehydrogenase family)
MAIATLRNQRVVVIGGSAGIGYAVAEGALAEGASVVIGSSRPANVEAAVRRLGTGAAGLAVDVLDEPGVAAFFQQVGGFAHLVFTAGDWGPAIAGGPIAQLDIEAAGAGMLGVRFSGALRAVKHAVGKIAPTGSITLTDGLLAHRPQKGRPLTTALTGAIEHLTRGLAVDLAPVRVNAVCPGVILAERWAKASAEVVDQMTRRLLVRRGGDPDEAAQAYLYLMRGGYTTGQVLIVDGGAMLV